MQSISSDILANILYHLSVQDIVLFCASSLITRFRVNQASAKFNYGKLDHLAIAVRKVYNPKFYDLTTQKIYFTRAVYESYFPLIRSLSHIDVLPYATFIRFAIRRECRDIALFYCNNIICIKFTNRELIKLINHIKYIILNRSMRKLSINFICADEIKVALAYCEQDYIKNLVLPMIPRLSDVQINILNCVFVQMNSDLVMLLPQKIDRDGMKQLLKTGNLLLSNYVGKNVNLYNVEFMDEINSDVFQLIISQKHPDIYEITSRAYNYGKYDVVKNYIRQFHSINRANWKTIILHHANELFLELIRMYANAAKNIIRDSFVGSLIRYAIKYRNLEAINIMSSLGIFNDDLIEIGYKSLRNIGIE